MVRTSETSPVCLVIWSVLSRSHPFSLRRGGRDGYGGSRHSIPSSTAGWLSYPSLRATFSPAHPVARRDVPLARSRAFRFTISLFREWPRLPFTARIERAPSHRASSASKKGTWLLPPHSSEAARCASTKDTQSSRSHPCFFQHLSCIRSLRPGYFLRRSFRHDLTTSIATLRSEVNDPIRILDHVEVVFDHYHGIAGFD